MPSHASLLPFLIFLYLITGCAQNSGPRVEAWRDGAYQPVSVESYSLDGSRDGSTTRAEATLTLEDGRQLLLQLELYYNPTPELVSGRWTLDEEAGAISAENIRFAGGQGEGPSVGGSFRLERDAAPAYRVELPLRAIASGWMP